MSSPRLTYTVNVTGYEEDDCVGSNLFGDAQSHKVRLLGCDQGGACDSIFVVQESHFSVSNFLIDLKSERTSNYENEVFNKIDLIITKRDYSYVTILILFKTVFTLCAVGCLVFFARRVNQFNFADIGIIQKKLLILICLLILFNEPLYYYHALIPYKIMSFVNTIVQATFVAFLLHFWAYLIDTISEEDMIRESPVRFYLPKLGLSVLIWIFLLISLTMVRMQEAADPTFYLNVGINQSSVKTVSWILFLLLVVYSIYLISITAKALSAIQRLKESYKFVIGST